MSRSFARFGFFLLLIGLAGPARAQPIRVAVPVTWQLTHTHISGPVTPSLTESFRETWRLEVAPSGMATLSSPRAKVIAYGLGEPREMVPRRVAVSEWDFARLVGVQPITTFETEDAEAMGLFSRPVFLSLVGGSQGGSDVNLLWSDDESYSVHFQVATGG
jgi:hypothetical protein